MTKPIYIIHSAMVEAIKAEFGGALPENFFVMDKIPSFSTKEKAMTDQAIEQAQKVGMDRLRIQGFQQRVIEEKAELDARLANLIPFLSSDTCHALPFDERNRLKRQAEVMEMYSGILGARIAAFPA